MGEKQSANEIETEIVTESESQVFRVECGAEGLGGSSCVDSQCEISCGDGQQHNVDCEGLSPLVSSPQLDTDGKVVLTVTCREKQPEPTCFPFCFGWGRR